MDWDGIYGYRKEKKYKRNKEKGKGGEGFYLNIMVDLCMSD